MASDRCFVVLDRDGPIIVEENYLFDSDAVELIAGASAALHRLAGLGLGLAVATNQSAVGRGYFDLERLTEIHACMETFLAGEPLPGIYASPHHPEEDCACRKPRTALVERAARDLGFEPRRAFVVGDMASDVDLGRALGATSFLVRTGLRCPRGERRGDGRGPRRRRSRRGRRPDRAAGAELPALSGPLG